jgi:hypothetical protein
MASNMANMAADDGKRHSNLTPETPQSVIGAPACAKLCLRAAGRTSADSNAARPRLVQTPERYLGTKQDLVHAPNDAIRLRVVSSETDRPTRTAPTL